MKPIKIDLPKELKELEIIPIADVHLGDPNCEYKRLLETLEYIKSHENAYCILNGDLMDSAIKTSIGDIYGASLQPMEQLKQCVKLFEPIKDKILCVLPGNHEGRIYKQDGVDMTQLMCNQLGIGDRYSNTTALVFVRFGEAADYRYHKRRVAYSIYVTHGSGGGRKEGGKINRLADLASIVDADIYIHSHTHLPMIFKESYYRADFANSSVSLVDKLFVNTAAWLGYGGYGDAQGYKPASIDSPVIYLNGERKKMRAMM